MPVHTIQNHECTNSIAARYGFHWREIWEHPDNEALREARSNPDVLRPGDELAIPELTTREVMLDIDKRHEIAVRTGLAVLRLRLQYDGEPLTGAYLLEVAGRRFEGELSDEGELEHTLPAAALHGTLTLVDRNEQIRLALGDLEPPESPAGAIERLVNLGLLTDRNLTELTPEVRHVLLLIQREEDLEPTGELDDDTADALRRLHGC